VPRGCPHLVTNLTSALTRRAKTEGIEETNELTVATVATVAVAGNFVDETNVAATAQHLRRNALVDPRAADLLSQFIDLGLVEN